MVVERVCRLVLLAVCVIISIIHTLTRFVLILHGLYYEITILGLSKVTLKVMLLYFQNR